MNTAKRSIDTVLALIMSAVLTACGSIAAYEDLYRVYKDAGYSDTDISSLLRIETPDNEFFNEKGIYNYHGGANVLFDDDSNLYWIISHIKGEQ